MQPNFLPVRYWGRKPVAMIQKYIDSTDEIIVDPFGGAGSVTLAAIKLEKYFKYSDINVFAWLISHVQVASANPDEYQLAVERILESLEKSLPDIPDFPPLKRDFLKYSNGQWFYKKRNANRITDFFSQRNYNVLRCMLQIIDNFSQQLSFRTSIALYLTFASILFDSSKMKRKNSGSWGVPSYWIPKKHNEEDPIKLFKRRARKFLNYFKSFSGIQISYTENSLNSLLLKSAFSLRYLPEYTVITDPPHSDEIQYLELSYFYWVWFRNSKLPKLLEQRLGKKIRFNFRSELTVNPKQGKDLRYYLLKLRKFLRLIRVCRRVVLILHEEKEDILRELEKEASKHFYLQKFEERFSQRNIGPRGNNIYNVYIMKPKSS